MLSNEPKLQLFNQITKSFNDILKNYELIKNLELKDGTETEYGTLCIIN